MIILVLVTKKISADSAMNTWQEFEFDPFLAYVSLQKYPKVVRGILRTGLGEDYEILLV